MFQSILEYVVVAQIYTRMMIISSINFIGSVFHLFYTHLSIIDVLGDKK